MGSLGLDYVPNRSSAIPVGLLAEVATNSHGALCINYNLGPVGLGRPWSDTPCRKRMVEGWLHVIYVK